MTPLVQAVALAIAKHFRGDKQPPMDPKQAIVLFEGAARAAIQAMHDLAEQEKLLQIEGKPE